MRNEEFQGKKKSEIFESFILDGNFSIENKNESFVENSENSETSTSKNQILLKSLYGYYKKELNMQYLIEVLNAKSCLSLRLIDWFVTKYCRNNNTEYIWDKKNFNVFNSYKSQLKAYSKKQMDPFCRNKRVFLKSQGHCLETTCGQMNFFKWAIENGILKYVVENYRKIDSAMKVENKFNSKKKISNHIEKRKITKKVFTNTPVPVTVFFD